MEKIEIEQKANVIVNHFMSKGATVSKEDYDLVVNILEAILEQ